jgi:hypothetical protein
MSKFKIYQIDHHDPIKVGRKNRRMFTLYSSLAFIIMLTININNISNHKPILVLTVFLPIAILIFIFLILSRPRIG